MPGDRCDTWELRNHPLIRRIGLDVNYSKNGVPLSTEKAGASSVHLGSHPGYSGAFTEFLNRQNRRNFPDDETKDVLAEVIEQIRQALMSGLPPIRIKDGGTVEVWRVFFARLENDLGLRSD